MTRPMKVGLITPATENSIAGPAWCFGSGDQEWAGLEEKPTSIAIERVLPSVIPFTDGIAGTIFSLSVETSAAAVESANGEAGFPALCNGDGAGRWNALRELGTANGWVARPLVPERFDSSARINAEFDVQSKIKSNKERQTVVI